MINRKLLALLMLGGFFVTASFSISDGNAQDKADKKDKKDKKKAEKKVEATKPSSIAAPNAVARPTAPAQFAKTIDSAIRKPLDTQKIQLSARADDGEFVRRAYLDITGVIPTADQAVRFIDDKSADKRSKLIDELLASKNYGRHMSDIWTTLMYPIDSDNRFVTKAPLREWLAAKFNDNLHWDKMAFELITANGAMDQNGATVYMIANRGVDKLTDSVGKLFLGVQIQCAQCHNHPFTSWKQAEYWGLAQFFYKVDVSNPRAAKDGGTIGLHESGRPNRKINPLPESAKDVKAKLLGGDQVTMPEAEPFRPVLAKWICAPENPFFAKAFVNRLWAQYFGRGFVNPVDDMSVENAPSHPELLNTLAKEFSNSGFDVKHLIRCICNSETYQRSSKPNGDNRDDKTMFSHQSIKVLTPEQLYDSLTAVVGNLQNSEIPRKGGNVAKGGPQGPRDQFAAFFMGTENAKLTDYEAGIPQALRLMNGPLTATGRLQNAVNSITGSANKSSASAVVERLYLATLSRRPTELEAKKLVDFIAKAGDARTAHADVLWVLMNSSEFALVR